LALEDARDQSAELWARCEFGKTLFAVGECQRPGEVQLDGSLLCTPHAKLLRLEMRGSTLLGTVLEIDRWLDDPNNQADQLRWQRVMRERDETVEELRFNRTLIEAHKDQNQ
jgi:hypothetical protein